MIAFIARLRRENERLKKALKAAYHSSNFDCLNRAGGEAVGTEFIQQERRRCASGQLVMICADVAGLGVVNRLYGEATANQWIRECLAAVRDVTSVKLISQLNSGDEFIFLVDRVDAEGLILRMRTMFKDRGFLGLYAASGEVDPNLSWIENADRIMKRVYEQKECS